ncbi:hypothetical protein QWU86_11610 [Neisseria gonorrhoeae]|jgi:acetyl-CoA carboxylase, biotin carboxylase subunit
MTRGLIQTNVPLHAELLRDPQFVEGGASIHYLEKLIAAQQH